KDCKPFMTSFERKPFGLEYRNMTRRGRLAWMVLAAIVLIPLFTFIGGEVVMRLWNWLIPPLFGWRVLSFWQALGLLVLCRILFGGHGWHRSAGPTMRSRMKERMAKRMANMTPEERERFRQGMGRRWGCGQRPEETK